MLPTGSGGKGWPGNPGEWEGLVKQTQRPPGRWLLLPPLEFLRFPQPLSAASRLPSCPLEEVTGLKERCGFSSETPPPPLMSVCLRRGM